MARRQSRPARPARGSLPSYAALVEFLRANPGPVGTREIARAFGLGQADLAGLRGVLRAIERSGELTGTPNRKFVAGPVLPEIIAVERYGSDPDGFALVRPAGAATEDAPSFRLIGEAGAELALGERALVRLIRRDSGEVEAE